MSTKKTVVIASGLAVGGAGVLVAGTTLGAPDKSFFEFKAHGMAFQKKGDGARTRVHTRPDGHVRIEDSTTVRLKNRGARKMTAVIEDQPIAAGGRQSTTITDVATRRATTFSYTPANNSITIASGGQRTVVVQNADHSYSVDGRPAANGKAAVALLRSKPAYRAASPHGVMLAYAYAHAPSAAARNTQNCDLPTCAQGDGQAGGAPARAPAVCTVFKDLCECIACDKLGKGDNCSTCR